MIGSTGAKSAAEEEAAVRILPSGTHAVLLELDDLEEVRAWHAAVAGARLPGVVDLVPAARTLLVVLDQGRTAVANTDATAVPVLDDLSRRLRELRPARSRRPSDPRSYAPGSPELEVPVRYDGDDLAEVAALWGCDAAEVVRRHTAERWSVAFCGFAPGFGYLVADPADLGGERWDVPRRDVPRTRVPVGSVGLAGPYTGVYPRESPGGWQLVGRTTLELFVPTREPPALLTPGRRVRFVDVT